MGGRVRPPGPGAPEASAIFAAQEEGRARGAGPGAARGCHALLCAACTCRGGGRGSARGERPSGARHPGPAPAAALRPAFKPLLPGARLFRAGRERRVSVCFVFAPVMEASADLTRRGGEARREPSLLGPQGPGFTVRPRPSRCPARGLWLSPARPRLDPRALVAPPRRRAVTPGVIRRDVLIRVQDLAPEAVVWDLSLSLTWWQRNWKTLKTNSDLRAHLTRTKSKSRGIRSFSVFGKPQRTSAGRPCGSWGPLGESSLCCRRARLRVRALMTTTGRS